MKLTFTSQRVGFTSRVYRAPTNLSRLSSLITLGMEIGGFERLLNMMNLGNERLRFV